MQKNWQHGIAAAKGECTYLAEGEEQHCEQKGGLDGFATSLQAGACRMESRYRMVNEE